MGKQFKERTEHRMVKVTDDWFPCYPNGEIDLSITLRSYKPYPGAGEKHTVYCVKIAAWGLDDTGVELEFSIEDGRGYAEGRYAFWKKHIFDKVPDGIDMMWFYEHGFVPA